MDRDLSRENLNRHGIYFDPNVYQANPDSTNALPDHVDAVRDGLLLMEKLLPEDCEELLREELAHHRSVNADSALCLDPPKSVFVRNRHHERQLQQSAAHDDLRYCEDISESTQRLLDESEEDWNLFWRTTIFARSSGDSSGDRRDQDGFK
jgi:hypothetical protein